MLFSIVLVTTDVIFGGGFIFLTISTRVSWWEETIFVKKDIAGTDTRTENQIPHVLTHRWMLNNENMWTQGEEHHTLGAVGRGSRGGTAGGGEG